MGKIGWEKDSRFLRTRRRRRKLSEVLSLFLPVGTGKYAPTSTVHGRCVVLVSRLVKHIEMTALKAE